MSDVPVNPAPEAPVAPAPAAPETPAPEAPATPPAPTPEQVADEAEQKEWDDAADELFPGIKGQKKEPKKDEPAEPKKGDEKPKEGEEIDPNETPEQKAEREAKAAKDAEELAKADERPDQAARDARIAARQSAQQVEAVKTDIREKLFADVPKQLQDADGDPIRTVEDVQKLINPRTNEPFTEEEAGMWLLSAQQQFNQNLATVERQIEQIAEVNVDIKDQADTINYEFGELLKSNTELRDKLWATYQKTLVKDEATGVITKAPVSLEEFYRTALAPYVELAKQKETDAANAEKAAQEAKIAEETRRKKARSDRSDIYGGSQPDTSDPEEKEWAEAAKVVWPERFGKSN